jgi:hypothetical protein
VVAAFYRVGLACIGVRGKEERRAGRRRRDRDSSTSPAWSEVGDAGGANPSARAGGGRRSRPSWAGGGPPSRWTGEPRGSTRLKGEDKGALSDSWMMDQQ